VPRVILSASGVRHLNRVREFLANKNPAAALRARDAIKKNLRLLVATPEIGRPDEIDPEYRELIIAFGDSGYIARYHYDGGDVVTITAIRHQKEGG